MATMAVRSAGRPQCWTTPRVTHPHSAERFAVRVAATPDRASPGYAPGSRWFETGGGARCCDVSLMHPESRHNDRQQLGPLPTLAEVVPAGAASTGHAMDAHVTGQPYAYSGRQQASAESGAGCGLANGTGWRGRIGRPARKPPGYLLLRLQAARVTRSPEVQWCCEASRDDAKVNRAEGARAEPREVLPGLSTFATLVAQDSPGFRLTRRESERTRPRCRGVLAVAWTAPLQPKPPGTPRGNAFPRLAVRRRPGVARLRERPGRCATLAAPTAA